MKRLLIAAVAIMVWSIGLGTAAYLAGKSRQADADAAAQLVAVENDAETLRIKNRVGTASGIRTEKAQTKTDAVFSKIRSEYEADQRRDPSIGCVLDPVSLRLWNAAATQSDGATAGEPDGSVRDTADPAAGSERGE